MAKVWYLYVYGVVKIGPTLSHSCGFGLNSITHVRRNNHPPQISRDRRVARNASIVGRQLHAIEQKILLERPLHPYSNSKRPTAAPEQYHLLTNLATAGPPAATAAAAASPQREAAAAPVLG